MSARTHLRLACAASCSNSQSGEPSGQRRSFHPSVPPQQQRHASRRSLLALVGAASSLAVADRVRAAIPPQPPLGSCPDCIGAENDALSACRLGDNSCISTFNDDEDHFQAPWSYDGQRRQAMDRLIDLATGKAPLPRGLVDSPYNRDRTEVAQFILGATAAFVLQQPLPSKPGLREDEGEPSEPVNVFDGRLDTVDYDKGYVRIVFGESANGANAVYDGEFLFFANDEICNVRVGSRGGGKEWQGSQSSPFSYTTGINFTRNGARELSEDLRKALRWGVTPVIVQFDPRFNNNRKLWFERPFEALRGNQSAFAPDEYDWRRIDLEDIAQENLPSGGNKN